MSCQHFFSQISKKVKKFLIHCAECFKFCHFTFIFQQIKTWQRLGYIAKIIAGFY